MSTWVKVLYGIWDSLNFESAVCQNWFRMTQFWKTSNYRKPLFKVIKEHVGLNRLRMICFYICAMKSLKLRRLRASALILCSGKEKRKRRRTKEKKKCWIFFFVFHQFSNKYKKFTFFFFSPSLWKTCTN